MLQSKGGTGSRECEGVFCFEPLADHEEEEEEEKKEEEEEKEEEKEDGGNSLQGGGLLPLPL